MNNTDNNEIVNTLDDKYIDDQFGKAPGNETLDETDAFYLTIDDDGDFVPFHQDGSEEGDGEQSDATDSSKPSKELTKFQNIQLAAKKEKEDERQSQLESLLSVDKLSEFARLKLEAKKNKDKEKLAELVELEKAYKAEQAAIQKEKAEAEKLKAAKAKEDQKAAEAHFKEQEKKEAQAKRDAERAAQMAHKHHLNTLAKDEPTPACIDHLPEAASRARLSRLCVPSLFAAIFEDDVDRLENGCPLCTLLHMQILAGLFSKLLHPFEGQEPWIGKA